MPKIIHPRLRIDTVAPPEGMKPLSVTLKSGEVLTPCVSPRRNEIYRAGFVVKKGGREIRFIGVPFDKNLHPSVLMKILQRDQNMYVKIQHE